MDDLYYKKYLKYKTKYVNLINSIEGGVKTDELKKRIEKYDNFLSLIQQISPTDIDFKQTDTFSNIIDKMSDYISKKKMYTVNELNNPLSPKKKNPLSPKKKSKKIITK